MFVRRTGEGAHQVRLTGAGLADQSPVRRIAQKLPAAEFADLRSHRVCMAGELKGAESRAGRELCLIEQALEASVGALGDLECDELGEILDHLPALAGGSLRERA